MNAINASKETAGKARLDLEIVSRRIDDAVPFRDHRDDIKRILSRIDAFLERAQAKLPTEEAYAKDKSRRRA